MEIDLKGVVSRRMNVLIERFKLQVIEVSHKEVLLRSNLFILKILAERDGVSIIYFDTSKKPVNGYNLFLFLLQKRRDKLVFLKSKTSESNFSDLVESQVVALTRNLCDAGEDILEGSKEWIRDYQMQTLPADLNVLDFV